MNNDRQSDIGFAQKLLSALAKARGLQSVADVGMYMMGNPVVISDKSWSVLAMAPDEDISSDREWQEFRKDGMLSISTVSKDVQSGLSVKLTDSDAPFIWENEGGNRRLFSNVIVGGRNSATISVLELNHPFTEEDLANITMLRDAVSAEMQKDKFLNYTRGMLHEELIENLLEGKSGTSVLAEFEMSSTKFGFKKNLYIHVLDIRGFDMENYSVPYIRNYLEKLIPDSRAVIYGDNIILVSSFERSLEYIETPLLEFMKNHNIKAGASRQFTDLFDLRFHYNEALAALSIGMHMDPDKYIFRYDEYAIYHIARLCSDNSEMFIHPKLTLLFTLDKEHDSSFAQSLYTYLKCNRNITDTANALHIHRNTLIYHLKRIEDLLDISIDDVDLLLHFEMSFRIMEYNKSVTRKYFTDMKGKEDA